MKISVVVPAFGESIALHRSLITLMEQTVPAHEVIVIDDGSPQPLLTPPWVRLHRINRPAVHRGSSAAKNLGARLATGDYLAFCDSDILHLPDALESLAAKMTEWESEGKQALLNTGRVGLPQDYPASMLDNGERLLLACRVAELLEDEDMTQGRLCFEQNESLISRRLFNSLGGYDEASFPSWGMNNQDLDLRVAAAGGIVSSAIPRTSTGKRLFCFHLWHENNCDRAQAEREFVAKWGEPWSNNLYHRIRGEANEYHARAGQ